MVAAELSVWPSSMSVAATTRATAGTREDGATSQAFAATGSVLAPPDSAAGGGEGDRLRFFEPFGPRPAWNNGGVPAMEQ